MIPVHPALRSLFSFLGPIKLGDFGDTYGSISLPDKILRHKAEPIERAVLDFFNKFLGSDQRVQSMDEASARAVPILHQITEARTGIADKIRPINMDIKGYEVAKSVLYERKDAMSEDQYRKWDEDIDNDIKVLEAKRQPLLDQLAEIGAKTDLVGHALSYYRSGGYSALADNPNLAGLTETPLPKGAYRAPAKARSAPRP